MKTRLILVPARAEQSDKKKFGLILYIFDGYTIFLTTNNWDNKNNINISSTKFKSLLVIGLLKRYNKQYFDISDIVITRVHWNNKVENLWFDVMR